METRLHVRSFDSRLSPEEFCRIKKQPVYVILDNLRSAFNVGSIIRTADCALIDSVYCCGITAHPPHKKLEKTALGALSYVNCIYRNTVMEALSEMKEKNIPVYALELTSHSRILWETRFPEPVALVVGNEALGVSHDILQKVDSIVEIPMLGYKNSINVAVAFGIVVYEMQRQYWNRSKKEIWNRNKKSHEK